MKHFTLLLLFSLIAFSCKFDQDKKETVQVEKPVEIKSEPKKVEKSEPKPVVKKETKTQSTKDSKKVSTPKKKVKKAPKRTAKPVKKTQPEPKKPMAVIKFDKKTLDFGELTEGDIVEHDFVFTNTGDAPLQILEADATCGCATPEIPFLDIPPGGKSKIHVTYNSVNKEGYETPSITLKTNGAPTYVKLELYGTIKPRKDKKPVKLEQPGK